MRKLLLRLSMLLGVAAILLGDQASFAQGDPVTIETDVSPPTTVVGTGEATVTIRIQGNAMLCPIIETDRPVDVVLVIDVSTSMDEGDKMASARDAAIGFVNTMDLARPPASGGDQVGVVTFSTGTEIISVLSQDRAGLVSSLQGIHTIGGTDIAAGLRTATDVVNDPNHENVAGGAVPVIVLLSDGQSDASSALAAADRAKATGTRVVTIGLGNNAETTLLRQIASTEADYYEAPSPADLPHIYQTIAHTIIPRTAASDLLVNFRYNRDLFELLPDTIEPPAVVEGDTLRWSYGYIENTETADFSFRVRALQPGSFPVGSIVDSSYIPCEQEGTRAALIAPDPFVMAQAPTPTPLPTATSTPLPTATPSPTPPPTMPPSVDNFDGDGTRYQTATASMGLSGGMAYCEGSWGYFPWLLLLILGLLLLLWAWRASTRPPEKRLKPLCFLARLALYGYLLFLIWLIMLPFFLSGCPKRESVFFWRFNQANDRTGVFVTSPNNDDAAAFEQINKNGCVGCHSVAVNENRVAAIADTGRLLVYDLDGTRVRLPAMVEARYVSLEANGQRAVIAQPNGDLAIVDFRDGSVTPLPGANDPTAIETMPSWGPTGRIAFARVANVDAALTDTLSINIPTDIYTISAPAPDGTLDHAAVAVPLPGASGEGFDYYPAYSPDGRWLAFTRHNNRTTYADEMAEIWLVPAAGGTPWRIEANNDDDGNAISAASNSWPSWSRDSQMLAFSSKRRDMSYDIYYADVYEDGSTSTAHLLEGGSDIGVFEHTPAWGPPPALIDPIDQLLSLWPWLLPLIPLLLLAWLLCRRPKPEPKRKRPSAVPSTPLQDTPLPPKLPEAKVLWEPRPTLIIGLGNTGRWVLTHLKKNLLDANKGKMPDGIKLLCLDTGNYTLLKQQDQTAAVTFAGVELSPGETLEIKGDVRPLINADLRDRPEFSGWLRQAKLRDHNLLLADGAGQSRPLARVGFLQQLQEDDDNLLKRVRALAPHCLEGEGSSRALRAIVIGDTDSDIGSAILLDTAVIIQRVRQEMSVPGGSTSAHLVSRRQSVTDQVNTAATLREIRRFQLAEARPFPIHFGVTELDGLCDWRPLDTLQIYDGQQTHRNAYELDVFPTVADAVIMNLDKATYQRIELRQKALDEETILKRVQKDSYRVHIASEGVYQYRLPYADLIDHLRYRFIAEVVRRLCKGNYADRYAVDEYFIKQGETATDLAQAFLSGQLGITPAPAWALAALGEAIADMPNREQLLTNLRQMDPDNLGDVLTERLYHALALLLNGKKKDQDPRRTRAGKVQLARNFLVALPVEIAHARTELQDHLSEIDSAQIMLAALGVLETAIKQAQAQLQTQADAHGVDDKDDALLPRVDALSADLLQRQADMEGLRTRTYIWHGENNEPLDELWYRKYMLKRLSDALGQFFWKVGANGITLTFVGPEGTIDLTPDTIVEVQAALYTLASRYCDTILNEESLAAALRTGPLLPHNLEKTAHTLQEKSDVLLDYPEEEARNHIVTLQFAANENVDEAAQIADILRPADDPNRLNRLPTTDPFVLGMKQRRALIPLLSTTVYKQTQGAYQRQYGLETGPDATQAQTEILTAVYGAEDTGLRLEQRFVAELRIKPHMIHPVISIGLSDADRARTFCLAFAAGEIEISGPLPGTDNEYEIMLLAEELDEGREIRIPPQYWDSGLHPLIQAYLWFVIDHKEFDAALLKRIHERYTQDEYLPEIWKEWRDYGWRDVLEGIKTPFDSDLNREILEDLLNITRLWIINFSRRQS
ncbi:MAG: VWA domain-containing protein [Anaerolineae bacterium]|nr:VWA domain-containing protein [Anaerolineae bacterium]